VCRRALRCPSGGALITARDNVPVASFVLLRGRCRTCRSPISVRYPLVELRVRCRFFAGSAAGLDSVVAAGALVLGLAGSSRSPVPTSSSRSFRNGSSYRRCRGRRPPPADAALTGHWRDLVVLWRARSGGSSPSSCCTHSAHGCSDWRRQTRARPRPRSRMARVRAVLLGFSPPTDRGRRRRPLLVTKRIARDDRFPRALPLARNGARDLADRSCSDRSPRSNRRPNAQFVGGRLEDRNRREMPLPDDLHAEPFLVPLGVDGRRVLERAAIRRAVHRHAAASSKWATDTPSTGRRGSVRRLTSSPRAVPPFCSPLLGPLRPAERHVAVQLVEAELGVNLDDTRWR